ncbi:MAG: YaeQ family protein [Bdellovibrionales bacterium]|nr:YaeQ family protein [Bdellovibrionales bacterium]
MAAPSSLYRFQIELSDVDRGVYRDLDFRIAKHPSENDDYLITRVIAFALNQTDADDLEIAPGLCVDDQPALYRKDPGGGYELWIEIGNPAPRRIHKAAKASRTVKIFTYKDPENLKREVQAEGVHRQDEIEVFSLSTKFLKELASHLERDNRWGVIANDGEINISIGGESIAGTINPHRLTDRE